MSGRHLTILILFTNLRMPAGSRAPAADDDYYSQQREEVEVELREISDNSR